jgi:sporulation protein YlmC with PRC-barrel domain
MKFNKKSTAICAFVVGAAILTTSAFADVMLGSGYYGLKNTAKTTMAKLTKEVDNFSVDATAAVKVDNETFAQSSVKTKFDIANQAKETTDTSLERGKIRESYWYSNQNQNIYKNSEDGSYTVVDKQKNYDNREILKNPLEDEQAADAERVVDALVGSLQDIIQIEESGGKKMYIGNLSDTQIPTLVNAVSSFVFKYSILDEHSAKRMNVPYPKSNIYVIGASGKAIENEDGIIESFIAGASISADDSSGIGHVYSVEISVDVKDINSTVVAPPDLNGQTVTYSKEGFEFDSKYIGKYKNDIVKAEGDSFVKHGERFIETTSVEEGNVKGRYYEVYHEGYEADAVRSFEFASNSENSMHYTIINYKDDKGESKKGIMHRSNMQNISISLDVIMSEDNNGYSYSNYDDDFDGSFTRIFE